MRLYLVTEEASDRESHRTPGTRGKEFEWAKNYEEFGGAVNRRSRVLKDEPFGLD
jgi:hypothetical protein